MGKLTLEEFISRATLKHGGKYDYSLSVYKARRGGGINIICPIHGVFNQRASSHLQGNGCRKCYLNGSRSLRYTTTQMIDKFKLVHGDRYDYSLVQYNGINNKVEIICATHGSFFQVPHNHLNGRGCVHCGRIFGLRRQHFLYSLSKPIIYVIKLTNSNEAFYKIGITARKSAKKRFATTMPYDIEVVLERGCLREAAYDVELTLHRRHKEWVYSPIITFSGHTECYKNVDIKFINKLLDEYVCVS